MMAGTSPQHENGPAHRFRGCSSISQFEVLDKLGEGTFGVVHKARSRKNGAIVALKQILMHNEKDGFPVTAIREIKLLKMLSHVNVLKLEEMAVERPKGKERKKAVMYMVTPYMEHDLSGLLENPDIQITESQIKCYMLQLLEGLRYIHNSHILHRDMKAANLLISNRGILQIADFGLARHYDEPVPQPGRGGGEARREYTCLVVTRWYRPPELLLELRRYTTAIDLWGVGCVFAEMFMRHPILKGESDLAQLQKIFDLVGSPTEENMPGWSSLPGCDGIKSFDTRIGNLAQVFRQQGSSAISLLSEFLKLDWRKRISAVDALQHPYFRNTPLPAKPHEIPSFEDSHELDRRKIRGQKGALPAAPAGGTVGVGANAEWAGAPGQQNGAAYASGPPSRDPRAGGWAKGPANQNEWRGGPDGRPPPPSHLAPYDRGPPPYHDQRRIPASQTAPVHRPAWQQQPQRHEIPPRPPPPQTSVNRPVESIPSGRNPPQARNNVDKYVPPYHEGSGGAPQRPPPPRDERRPMRDDREYRDRDDASGQQPYPRERDRYVADRRNSYDNRGPAQADRRGSGYDDHSRGAVSSGGGGGLPYIDRDHRRTRSRSPEGRGWRDRNRDRDREKDYRR